jgi:dihydroorotate dehydrogenase electron transfer subunit
MSEVGEGAIMELLGPLGNGFNIPSEPAKLLLVAGGTGIAALHALAQHVSDTESGAEITLLMGGKKAEDIICVDDFEELGASVLVATEDGSLGREGRVTDLLEDRLAGPLGGDDVALYSCGPREMLKEVARLAGRNSLPCAVSLEERMGCGMGACLGCVIRVLPGSTGAADTRLPRYKRICRDGPVFDAAEIDWEAI